ncbi:hypothetical protein AB0N05_35585 [Nocardia sp. NPDC051030]|uniref:hypothetical protein n=1 Tax=Nocardia sp. NPDC051030 TaxID=3155162 RepID=UPI00342C5EAB
MNRCAVTTLLATVAILSAAPAVASADIVLTDATSKANDDPMQSSVSGSASGSAQTGSSGGLATTGSTGTGSFGLPNLDKILLGNFKTLCAVTGSAVAILGEASFGCDSIGKAPATI